MNHKYILAALAVASIGITSAHAANTFSFAGSGATQDGNGDPIVPTGSWYQMTDGGTINSYMGFRSPSSTDTPGPNGTLNFDIVNTLTTGTPGNHNSGNMIDRDETFLGEWTAHLTTGALEITWDGLANTATANMSDWRWYFNGITYDLGAGAPALLDNQDGIWGNGNDTLDYTTAMLGAFTGFQYNLHLVGSANLDLAPVPEPSAYALMLSGLGLVGLAARRRK